MNSYPADEQRLREVERGWSCATIVALPAGETLAVGDSILFALAQSQPGQEPAYVKGGDSVRVLLTSVTDVGTADPITGQTLVQLTWDPLGQAMPMAATSGRVSRSRRARGTT